VNELLGSDHLQFTCEIWDPTIPLDVKPRNNNVTIHRGNVFPYLDMEFYWPKEELKFRVHLKENQLLKYLNVGSTHTNATFKSIPSGVLMRLAILTSLTPENADLPNNVIYHVHVKALERTGLKTPDEYPTLRELQNKLATKLSENESKTN